MTAQEIIKKIRAEVERMNAIAKADVTKNTGEKKVWHQGIVTAYSYVLSFLSDLEKEEKPKKGLHHGSLRKVDNPMKWMEDDAKEQTTAEGFDGEFSKFSNDVDAEHPFPICVDEFKDFARHFYELGQQSKEQPLLPGFENEQPGIPGKDFVPVAWCDALEQYGIWRIERVVQPVCEELGREMDRFFTSKEYAEAEKAGFGEAHSARHFAQWGAEHSGSSEIPKDLEEAAEEYSKERAEGHILYDWVHAFIAGAKWDRQQMMKDGFLQPKETTLDV